MMDALEIIGLTMGMVLYAVLPGLHRPIRALYNKVGVLFIDIMESLTINGSPILSMW
jgi:hypothetical protein